MPDGGKKHEPDKDRSRNVKNLDGSQLKKLTTQQRSKYMAYREPPKEISEAQSISRKRVLERSKMQIRGNISSPAEEKIEREKHAKLIGQLKAAEARNRLRIMRLRFQSNRNQETSHLISCQPSALKAVRLEALLPQLTHDYDKNDQMDKLDRERCEQLIEDDKGLLTHRIP